MAAARAAAGASGGSGDGPPCVYLRLPVEAGPQAWRAGLYARVDEGVYRRVSQEPPEAFQDSYLYCKRYFWWSFSRLSVFNFFEK